MSLAAVNGARLWYELRGAGRPVVLLHAGGTDATIFDAQVDALSWRCAVLRFDARGYGRSTHVPGGAFSRVEDLLGVMDAAGLERAALVGVSQGARVALDAALASPERVSALLLASPTPPGTSVPGEAEALAGGDVEGAIELGQRHWLAGPHRRLEELDPDLRARLAAMDRRAMSAPPLGPERVGALDDVRGVAVPTLVVAGELDRDEVHDRTRRLAAEIPGARLRLVAGAGHLVNLERPAEFSALVVELLEGHAAGGDRG